MEHYIQPIFFIAWALWLVYSFIIRPRSGWQSYLGMLLSSIAIFSLFFLLTRDFKSDSVFFIESYRYSIDSSKKEIIIGNSEENSDITVENASAAGRHVKLTLNENNFDVQNISDDKKVDINGKYLNLTDLKPGDEIVLAGNTKLKVLNIGPPYPLGRALTLSLSQGGAAKIITLHTLLNKNVSIPSDAPGTLAVLSYEPHFKIMGSSIYYVIAFFMVFLLSTGIYLYLKNRFNGALLLLMMAFLPFGAGLIGRKTLGIIVAISLVFILYVERKRKTDWRWASFIVILLYASVFTLPSMQKLDGDFLLSHSSFSRIDSPSIQITRGNSSFNLFDKKESLPFNKPHNIILGHTSYDLSVDHNVVTLSPRDPERIHMSQNLSSIIGDISEVKPGYNYILFKFPHNFKSIPAKNLSSKSKITISDNTGNYLTLSKTANSNYRFFLNGLIFFIVIPFWLFTVFFINKSFFGIQGRFFQKKPLVAEGFVIFNLVYFMLGLGYVMFGALALYNNSYFKNFSKFRDSGLPLFVFLFLGLLFLSKSNRFIVFLSRVFRQKIYNVPLLVTLVIISLTRFSFLFFIAGVVFFIFVFGFRLRRGIVYEYKNARSYPVDIKKLIETPVCDFESNENKRLFFGLGGLLNKTGWNCLLFADLLLLLALFFIALQIFLGSELGVSVGGFVFLPIELGKILLTVYFADWVSRIDKGMKFNVLWVYGLVMIPFVLLIVFLKDFSPLIIFMFVFFYHIIKINKSILFKLSLIIPGLMIFWMAVVDMNNYKFPARSAAAALSLPVLFFLVGGLHPRALRGLHKRLLLLLVSVFLLFSLNYIIFSRPHSVPKVLGDRVSSWLNPWQDYDKSYQYISSVWLMKGSGTFGRGSNALAAASQVPLVEKDMTFSLVVGVLGILGAGLLLLTLFLTAKAAAARRESDSPWYGYVLEFLTVIFLAQFLAPAMGGVGILPLMGQPLPFLSYSNNILLLLALPFSLLMMGIAGGGIASPGVKEIASPGVKGFKVFCFFGLIIVVFVLLRLNSVSYPRDIEERADVVYLESFHDRVNLFKIESRGDRFRLTPYLSDLKVAGKTVKDEVELQNGDLVVVEGKKFQFRVYPGEYVYKEVFCQSLGYIFPTPKTVKYIGGFTNSDREQVLSSESNRNLLKKIIIEIAPEVMRTLVQQNGGKPGPVFELKWDSKALKVKSLLGDLTRIQGIGEERVSKGVEIRIEDGDILKLGAFYIKFDFRRFEGTNAFAISYRERGDYPYHSSTKPEAAILKSLETGMIYDIHPSKETLFIGKRGLYSFNLEFSDFFDRLYIPDKVSQGSDKDQKRQASRPSFWTAKSLKKPIVYDEDRNILAYSSEINGEYRRFFTSNVPPDLLYILGAKSEETWGLEQVFSRLYREGRISDMRLTLNVEWQKIALEAMRKQLLANRDSEMKSPKYLGLKRKLDEVESLFIQARGKQEAAKEIDRLQDRIKQIKQEIDLEKNRLYEAAVVLMDPSGRILTAASYPYDEETLMELNPEIPKSYKRDTNPYLNRAWKWKYNPGSTAKILDSIAFLASQERFPYLNRLLTSGSAFGGFPRSNLFGSSMLNGKQIPFHLANFEGHNIPPGFCSLTDAFTHSYNTYFSYLALHDYSVLTNDSKIYEGSRSFIIKSGAPINEMYREYPVLEYAERLLMNRQINLLGNLQNTPLHPGLTRMPNDAFMTIESVFPVNSYTMANIAHYSIGQGDFQLTALQNAMIASTVLNDGALYLPSIVRSVTLKETDKQAGKSIAPDPQKFKFQVYPSSVAVEIKEAMRQVVLRGTAGGVFGDLMKDRVFYAKTGTAETGLYKDNAIFTGFVKFKNGTHIIYSVIVPRSGLGARIAGKLTAQVIRGIIEHETKKGNLL